MEWKIFPLIRLDILALLSAEGAESVDWSKPNLNVKERKTTQVQPHPLTESLTSLFFLA